MKKISLLLSTVLLMTSLSCVVGCKKEEKTEEKQVEMMYDFEDVKRNLYQLEPIMDFGVISINKDAKYVSQGEASYKLQPMGVTGSTAKPVLILPTYSNEYDYNFMDFTLYKTVVMDLYNTQTEEIHIDVGLSLSTVTRDSYQSFMKSSPVESFTLLPGWNTVTYVIPHDWIAFSGNLSEVYGVFVAFENSRSMLAADSSVIYIDNVRIEKLPEKHQVNTELRLKTDEEKGIYEVLSFDEDYQRYLVWVSRVRDRKMHPDIEIYNPLLGEEIGNVLKFNARSVAAGTDVYPTSVISGAAIRQAFENAKKDGDTYDYYFCVDIYNDCDVEFTFRMEFLSTNTETTERSELWKEPSLKPHSWTTWEYNLNEVNVVTGKDASGNKTTKPYLSDMGDAWFIWEHFHDVEERRVFWLDNVRIERREKVTG